MISKVRKTISRYNMLTDGGSVCTALSGGADSVSLLCVLKELGYKVSAVHVNHNLRGEESFRDENFCISLCKTLGVPLKVVSVDVRGYCEKNGVSLELGARDLRYKALYEAADCERIALAHTLSDCLETALFNLARGTGAHGLASVPPVRDRIVRPLINCSRSDVEEYLRQKNLGYVTDSTNLSDGCSRNIIRHRVIPELERINPGLMKSFSGTVEALREADRYIESAALEILESRGLDFSDIPDGAALSRAVSIAMQREGIEPSAQRIAAAKELISRDGRINIKKGVYLCSRAGRLFFERPKGEPDGREYRTDLRSGLSLGEKELIVTKISHFDISRYQKKELRYIVDTDKLSGEYVVRHVRGGEKIRLAGRGMTQEIKKLLSASERRERYVIADGEGVIYVEGVGVSERAACGADTVSALKIDIKGEGQK